MLDTATRGCRAESVTGIGFHQKLSPERQPLEFLAPFGVHGHVGYQPAIERVARHDPSSVRCSLVHPLAHSSTSHTVLKAWLARQPGSHPTSNRAASARSLSVPCTSLLLVFFQVVSTLLDKCIRLPSITASVKSARSRRASEKSA